MRERNIVHVPEQGNVVVLPVYHVVQAEFLRTLDVLAAPITSTEA
jgi:hypothetical protein